MVDLDVLRGSLDGEVFTAGTPGYDEARRPAHAAFQQVRPRLVIRCRSVSDVVHAVRYASATGERIVPRSGGHCFAGRSSTDGIVLDLCGLDGIDVGDDGAATIGAGARLGAVYRVLGGHGRTLPAGCGATVGIAGLTLGGGIGLLGRRYGLTCDRLVGAQVVLADGRVVECDRGREPDLFWALRGAGGGQFGVVTSLRFDTVPAPSTARVEAHWSGAGVEQLVAAWQVWAPDAPDGLTLDLDVVAEPGRPVRATLFGAATPGEHKTENDVRGFVELAGPPLDLQLRGGMAVPELKRSFDDPLDSSASSRLRSELFSQPLSPDVLRALLAHLAAPGAVGRRRLAFTALGGAYNRVAEDATAFAHRGERFLLQHLAEPSDRWIDTSWTLAHAEGSGRVYPNFPDPALDDWTAAYHAGNAARLANVKDAYDPARFFNFPQAI